MDNNVTNIFVGLVKEVREDIKLIRDTLAPMKVDLELHIRRTDLNEHRIEELEEKLISLQERRLEQEERKLRMAKMVVGIIASAVGIAFTLHRMGVL